jgi:uncharacterized protein
MILKLLLIIAVITTVYYIFFKKKPIKKSPTSRETQAEASDMVECANCGIYSQLNDSILSNGKYYCSSECVGESI